MMNLPFPSPSSSSPYCSSSSGRVLRMVFLASLLASYFLGVANGGNLYEDCEITWGEGRGRIVDGGQLLSLSLDKTSGSGFQSYDEYLFAKIDVQIKLVSGNSAGTVATFFLSSQGDSHDEIDFEFLGNSTGDPYTIHTNIYANGTGNREQQFRPWFNPTTDFHSYSILWNPQQIIFLIDGVPLREFKNHEAEGIPFPNRKPMRVYASLWDAEDWATRGGLVKTDWTKAPFTAYYRNYSSKACILSSDTSECISTSSTSTTDQNAWFTEALDSASLEKMKKVQKKDMIYNYCTDLKRFPQGVPGECHLS